MTPDYAAAAHRKARRDRHRPATAALPWAFPQRARLRDNAGPSPFARVASFPLGARAAGRPAKAAYGDTSLRPPINQAHGTQATNHLCRCMIRLSEQRKPGLAPGTAKSVRLRRATLVPDCGSGRGGRRQQRVGRAGGRMTEFAGTHQSDTHQKALRINLDPRWYGTIAEIGAGQEVARWFFRVGGAAGTIASSISAYDMAVSDAVYGKADRYVSAGRLQGMLDKEFQLNVERLGEVRGDETSFFAFADTVVARSFRGGSECHGWMGVKFQAHARDEPSQIVMHVRMLDVEAWLQQEALGIVGVNLLYGRSFSTMSRTT